MPVLRSERGRIWKSFSVDVVDEGLMLAECALLSGSTGAGSDVLEHLVHLVVFPTAGHLIHVTKGLSCLGCTFGHSLEELVVKKLVRRHAVVCMCQ